MAKFYLLITCLVTLHCQSITSYTMLPSTSTSPSCQIFDSPYPCIQSDFIPPKQPCIPGPISVRPQTIITDCTPQVCKNLANTIQLMIVSNLLKNSSRKGSAAALRLAAPVLREVLTSIQTNSPGLLNSAVDTRLPISGPQSLINCGSGIGQSQSKLLNALASFGS